MKKQQFKSLGIAFELPVPSTVEEFDTNAKRAGACLEEAISNIVYRNGLAEFRYYFLHGREADKDLKTPALEGVEDYVRKNKVVAKDPETGKEELVLRRTKATGRKDEDGQPVLAFFESEANYFDRVLQALGKEPSFFQDLANKHAALIAFDASQKEKKPAAPKKLAQKYKDVAVNLLKGPKKDKFIADYKKLCGKDLVLSTNPADAEKNIETTGWAIKEFAEEKDKQQLAALV